MKKHIGKFVVMALVAMFALSSQSEAACVNIYQAIYKMKQEERAHARACGHAYQHKKHHKCHHDAKRAHRCGHVVRNRKGCCRHGR